MNFFRNHIGVEMALILYWCAYLSKSDAHIAPYLLVGLLALYFAVVRSRSAFAAETFSKSETRVTNGFAFLLASTVVLANYKMFLGADDGGFLAALASGRFKAYQGIAEALLLWGIGFLLFKEILIGVAGLDGIETDEERLKHPKRIFWICWGLLVAEHAILLVGALYPGIVGWDSAEQLKQIFGIRSYSNHHSYHHTQLIHAVIAVGMKFFGDINKAVFLYCFFSLLVMSSCFMYIVETVYIGTQNKKLSLMVFLFYLLMPIHVLYSVFMYKDVFFGAAVACFAVACYRNLKSIGNSKWNWAVLIVSSFGMTLFRSNGWIAFLITTAIFISLFGKNQKKMIASFFMILLTAFILKYPVLQVLNVPQPDLVEKLSIPIQQISRVIVDHKPLPKEQEQLLRKVVDIETVPQVYKREISDPVKGLIRRKGNQECLRKQSADFAKLYIRLGFQYPHKYLEAWIDLTKGFWNSGYTEGARIWIVGISGRAKILGIKRTINSSLMAKGLNKYLELSKTNPFLQLFLSIGAYVWGMMILSYRAFRLKNKEVIFATVPFLTVLATLLIATPIAEFRYVYCIFCGFPFLLAIAFAKNPKEVGCENREAENAEKA